MTEGMVSGTSQRRSSRRRESVRAMVRRGRDTEALHFVEQGGAFQSEPRGCSPGTTEFPIGALTGSENFLTDFVLKRRICNLSRCRFELFDLRRLAESLSHKDYASAH